MIANETLKIIKRRRSNRSYADDQIRDEELRAILEAGMYAPNAGDEAWHFTVVQNRDLLDRLNIAAKEVAKRHDMEQLRAMGGNEGFDCLYGAPTLIIISADGRSPMPLEADCAAATQNLLLAAESIGLGSCWIYFVLLAFQSPQGPELLKEMKIPEGYRPYSSVVIGHRKNGTKEPPARKPDLVTFIR